MHLGRHKSENYLSALEVGLITGCISKWDHDLKGSSTADQEVPLICILKSSAFSVMSPVWSIMVHSFRGLFFRNGSNKLLGAGMDEAGIIHSASSIYIGWVFFYGIVIDFFLWGLKNAFHITVPGDSLRWFKCMPQTLITVLLMTLPFPKHRAGRDDPHGPKLH